MNKAAWCVVVVVVAAAASLAEEQSVGEASPWVPAAHTPSWAWYPAVGGDSNTWYPTEGGEGEEEETPGPWVAKRQPPHRLGSVVDLYRTMAHGLVPLSAKPVMAAPERRSARWPAACKFIPFSLVCWNAARRGAVMRQRPMQYSQ